MSVVQHPYGESDQDLAQDNPGQKKAYTGYIGPFPAMDGERKHKGGYGMH